MNNLIALLLVATLSFAHSGQDLHQEEGWPNHSGNFDWGLPGPHPSYWEDNLSFEKYNAHLALHYIEVQIRIRSRHRWEFENIVPPMNVPVLITGRSELLSLYVIDSRGGETLIATLESPIDDERTMSSPTGHIMTPWRTFFNDSEVFTITDPAIKSMFTGPGEVILKVTSLNNVNLVAYSPLYIWHAKTITRGRVLVDYLQ